MERPELISLGGPVGIADFTPLRPSPCSETLRATREWSTADSTERSCARSHLPTLVSPVSQPKDFQERSPQLIPLSRTADYDADQSKRSYELTSAFLGLLPLVQPFGPGEQRGEFGRCIGHSIGIVLSFAASASKIHGSTLHSVPLYLAFLFLPSRRVHLSHLQRVGNFVQCIRRLRCGIVRWTIRAKFTTGKCKSTSTMLNTSTPAVKRVAWVKTTSYTSTLILC